MNNGNYTRQTYDEDAYSDKLDENNGIINYRINANYSYNQNGCLQSYCPDKGAYGVSTYKQTSVAPSQELTDLDSVFSNRGVRATRSKKGHVNTTDLTPYAKSVNARLCGNKLNAEQTRLTHPPSSYKEMNINRFYNLIHNPQDNIFWDFAEDTKLQAKDNYHPSLPEMWNDNAWPTPQKSNKCPK